MNILTINKQQNSGGVARIARDLFEEYKSLGHQSYYVVDIVESKEENVFSIQELTSNKYSLKSLVDRANGKLTKFDGKVKGIHSLRITLQALTNLNGDQQKRKGWENFYFPGTWKITSKLSIPFDVVQLHNLHDNYFDLNYLPYISNRIPTVASLHDEWLLTGHCAYAINCSNWKTGCGNCPDINIYPPITKDATDFNWKRKQLIYSKSNLNIVVHSQWLYKNLQQSMLWPNVKKVKIIPTGVDQNIFKPTSKKDIRSKKGMDENLFVLLFVGHRTKSNPFKDYLTLEAALFSTLLKNAQKKVLFICLGEKGEDKEINGNRIIYMPYINDLEELSHYYQAADLFVHAAKSDNFPNTILEALSCGTPVIASAVGGIPEEIEDGKTGYLFPKSDSEALASKINDLIENPTLLGNFQLNAISESKKRFSRERMAKDYIDFYQEVIDSWNTNP